MEKINDSVLLEAAMLNGAKEEVMEKCISVCNGNVMTRCTLQILLDFHVEESIAEIWEDFDETFGTSGFVIGDECYYEYDDIDELRKYLDNFFKVVISMLVKFNKLETATQILMRLVAVATSMYGSGSAGISNHIIDLAEFYWHQILRLEHPDTKCAAIARKFFKSSKFKMHLKSYGYDDLYDHFVDCSNPDDAVPAEKSLETTYIKKFKF